MDSKKYLEQLSMIDLDINSKLMEIDDLTKLTKKLSGVTENMIVGADSSESILSPTMRKIVDLQTVYPLSYWDSYQRVLRSYYCGHRFGASHREY